MCVCEFECARACIVDTYAQLLSECRDPQHCASVSPPPAKLPMGFDSAGGHGVCVCVCVCVYTPSCMDLHFILLFISLLNYWHLLCLYICNLQSLSGGGVIPLMQ